MRFILVLVAVAATALVGASSAAAKHPPDSFTVGDAAILGPVHVRGDVATVHARYSCTSGDHLWVSVKQNASASIDPAVSAEGAGFGGAATAWWQSHAGSFVCDGRRHVQWFTVDTAETIAELGSTATLQKGWAWVQFCITFGDEGLDAIRMQWSRVVVN